MLAFPLKKSIIKHDLVRRSKDRIAAKVCGRTVPTIETEEGRDALLPNGALPWALKQGIPVYSLLPGALDY